MLSLISLPFTDLICFRLLFVEMVQVEVRQDCKGGNGVKGSGVPENYVVRKLNWCAWERCAGACCC